MRAALPATSEALSGLPLPRLSLRRNFAWTLGGNVAYATSQWAMLIVLAKLGSPELVGQFALALAVTNPILLFAGLHLRSVQATDVRGEHPFSDYLRLRLATATLAMLVTASVAFLGGFRTETALVILAVGAAKAVESVSDILHGLFQVRERMDLAARSLVVRAATSLIAFAAAVYYSRSLLWGAASLIISWLAVLLLVDLPSSRALLAARETANPGWNRARLWNLAWLALPLGLGQMLRGLELSIPRLVIEHRFGERELGLFVAIAYLTVAGTQLINALGQSATARLSQEFSTGDRRAFGRLLARLIGAGVLVGAVGLVVSLVAGSALLTCIYNSEYAKHTDVLCWMMVAAAVTYAYVFLGTALNAMRLFRPRLALHALTLPVLIIACCTLGWWHGLRGVAEGICLAEFIAALAYCWLVRRALRGSKPS